MQWSGGLNGGRRIHRPLNSWATSSGASAPSLGADARDVLGLIVREGMTLVAIGVGIGLIGSIFAARAIESYLFGIRPIDGVTFVAGPLMLGGIALAACLIPAWRATRVDPTTALRTVQAARLAAPVRRVVGR
jgi:predicted lysophospholipase L1 biosynthesis ABC-type transport system permease subunit